jgi:hypothetical protein
MFHVLRWSGKCFGLIGTYYFQIRAKESIAYIVPISSDKWDHWRENWVVVGLLSTATWCYRLSPRRPR